MSWMLSMWVAAALLVLCMGESSVLEGMNPSESGYHMCIHNETRLVSFLAIHKVPYTVTKPCGDWLLFKTCTVTLSRMVHQIEYRTVTEEVTRCCDGYEQVGRYCAPPVNRIRELTAKPGSCPTADGSSPGSEACEWDMDCPGWQKCCHRLNGSFCSNPASPSNYSSNGGWRFNATVTVKADYQQLMTKTGGHLNHLRLLQGMVAGAMQADVSVRHLSSWPLHPYRTASSLLLECNSSLSLHSVTSELYLLLAHIQEVLSVNVEDVNECALPALRQCSSQANCTNTEGSYYCTCPPGYSDVDPSNPGAYCRVVVSESAVTEPQQTHLPPMKTTYTSASTSTEEPLEKITVGFSVITDLRNMSSVPSTTLHDPQWASPEPLTTMISTVESTPPTTTCSPPSITGLWSANVTGVSFSVSWTSQSQTNQTYQVIVQRGSKVIHFLGTSETVMEVQRLQPGAVYRVTVTPCACGSQGGTSFILVKTDAQTLDATARLTNIEFSADLLDTSSQAYRNLTESLTEELYQSLPAEVKAMVNSGQVIIEIRGFSPGSVMVNLTLIFTTSQKQDIMNVSTDVMNSLLKSVKYKVDINNTSITDFDECASGENDCSQWATCTNTWASYKCACPSGFEDRDTERPGRACQAIPKMASITTSITPATSSTASTAPFSPTTQTSEPAMISATTTPETATVVPPTIKVVTLGTLVLTDPDMSTVVPIMIPTQASTTAIATTTTVHATAAGVAAVSINPPTTSAPRTSMFVPTMNTLAPASTRTSLPAPTTPAHGPTRPAPAPTTLASTTTSAPTTPASITTSAHTTPASITTSAPTTPASTTTSAPTTPASITTSAPTTPASTTTSASSTPASTTTSAPSTPTSATTSASASATLEPTTTTLYTITTSASITTNLTPVKTSLVTTMPIPTPTTTSAAAVLTTVAFTTTIPVPTTASSATSTSAPALKTSAPTPTPITSALAPTTPAWTATIPVFLNTTSALKTSEVATTTTLKSNTTTLNKITTSAPTPAPSTTSDAQIRTTTSLSTPSSVTRTTKFLKTTSTKPKTSKASPVRNGPQTTMSALPPIPSFPTTTHSTSTTAPTTHTTVLGTATYKSMLGAISVQCRVAAITVAVARDFLLRANIDEATLYLGLPECRISGGNDTHAELTVGWNECVTRLVHNETFYTASVTLFNSIDPAIGEEKMPKMRLEVPIMCTFMKSMLISADFGPMGYDMIKDVIVGSGSFQVTVQLMNGTIPLPHNYSLSPKEDLVVEVSLNTSSEQIKVVINKCWATPTKNPRDTYSHTFLEKSCSLNTFTKVLINGNSSTSRVSVKIFSIVNLSMIYLHCQVQICVQIGSDTCVPDCLQRTAQSLNTIGTAFGSSGPVLRSDEGSVEEEFNTFYVVGLACLGIGVSLFFIIGFICLFYYQRNRIGHYNFSVKPKQENFTYLVFNT